MTSIRYYPMSYRSPLDCKDADDETLRDETRRTKGSQRSRCEMETKALIKKSRGRTARCERDHCFLKCDSKATHRAESGREREREG